MINALQQAAPLPEGPGEAGISPVAGYVVQNFGDPTVAGPATGLIYRAAPGARVVAPCAGPVLFADKFQSYGLLVIIGCSADYDFVLSGMSRLNVAAGQRLARGQPVGVMLGYDAKNPGRQPALYVELRQNGTPVDPANWLTGGGSG
jgi:septal ring factor EnvC (AmiA/AmiB activator)